MKNALEVLKESFGYDCFKSGQQELIDHILHHEDVLGIMPTGAGKSLCYQVPALMMEGITLVICPLISLMKDQVAALVASGIPGAYFNSSLTWNQYKKALHYAKQGRYKIIYVAPERLMTPAFQDFVQSVTISMVAVDEAHCVSQWGQNFRPSYLQIPEFLQTLPVRPVVAAFTATATGLVKEDIEKLLGLQHPYSLTTGFDRPNLYFGVEQTRYRDKYIRDYVTAHKDEPGIIYCLTRRQVEDVHDMLTAQGFSAARYHAGLSDDERRQAQDDFIYDRCMVMVATNAFGMGIDKSNVRYVIHYAMPGSLENYYQEAGRAGRDGEKAECILLYSPRDMHTHQYFLDHPASPNPDPAIQAEIYRQDFNRLMRMREYCSAQHCLRCYILEYFGQTVSGKCDNCSVCTSSYVDSEITQSAYAAAELISHLPHAYGVAFLTDMLKGANTERVRKAGLMEAPGYGALRSMDRRQVQEDLEALILSGYLIRSNDKYRTVTVSGRLLEKKKRKEKIYIRERAEDSSARQTSRKMQIRTTRPASEELFRQLVRTRTELAGRNGVPPYIIFSDQTLHAMSAAMPLNKEEMLLISGVGELKYERYGKAFINTIQNWIAETSQEKLPSAPNGQAAKTDE